MATPGLPQGNLRAAPGQPQDCPEAALALSLPSGQSLKQCPALPLVSRSLQIIIGGHIKRQAKPIAPPRRARCLQSPQSGDTIVL